jgi:hypothetical protein
MIFAQDCIRKAGFLKRFLKDMGVFRVAHQSRKGMRPMRSRAYFPKGHGFLFPVLWEKNLRFTKGQKLAKK